MVMELSVSVDKWKINLGAHLLLQRGRYTGIQVFILLCVCHELCWLGYSGYPASLSLLLKRCLQISGCQVSGYQDTRVSGYSGYYDLMTGVSLEPFSLRLPSAFLVLEILDLTGVGRDSYSSPSASRQGTRIFFPLLLCIPAFFSKLMENSFLVPAILGG
ncbi:hypothetical protein LWI29_031620 [Acer saccharum]|uniref:Uncharacterized protein n=1 Tax=Acer saccharum TaxID=4024 RepID=A0AA39TLK3_ACESA|nr:hypothetical protein LWI29_031620 [Acer saccharum]